MRLIDADALKNKMLECSKDCFSYGAYGEYYNGKEAAYLDAADLIDEAPTVEERKHGYWKKEGSWYKCSCCNSAIDPWDNTWMKYCSCCGAIMDGKEGEEE